MATHYINIIQGFLLFFPLALNILSQKCLITYQFTNICFQKLKKMWFKKIQINFKWLNSLLKYCMYLFILKTSFQILLIQKTPDIYFFFFAWLNYFFVAPKRGRWWGGGVNDLVYWTVQSDLLQFILFLATHLKHDLFSYFCFCSHYIQQITMFSSFCIHLLKWPCLL